MKKSTLLIFLTLLIALLSLQGCTDNTFNLNATAADITAASQTQGTGKNVSIETLEDLIKIDNVVSLTKTDLEKGYDFTGILSYRLIFISEGLKIAADISLPQDYLENSYPVMLYFPEITPTYGKLASSFTRNKIITFALNARGVNGSEGVRDLGGKDIADALALLNICRSADFLNGSKLFAAGSSEGSITLLKLIQNDKDHVIKAAAIIDSITDLKYTYETRDDKIKNLCETLIGGTPDELPEEYDLRSAVSFADDINTPLLIMYYKENKMFDPITVEKFASLLNEKDKKYLIVSFDSIGSDFMNDTVTDKLLQWFIINMNS